MALLAYQEKKRKNTNNDVRGIVSQTKNRNYFFADFHTFGYLPFLSASAASLPFIAFHQCVFADVGESWGAESGSFTFNPKSFWVCKFFQWGSLEQKLHRRKL
jgi:hypothetical protein